MKQSIIQFFLNENGDMVERGLILVAIIVAAVGLWYSLGEKLATNLSQVVGSF